MAKAGSGKPKAKKKTEPKPKLTDAERHRRFVETARQVEASEDPKDFDQAFDALDKASKAKRSQT